MNRPLRANPHFYQTEMPFPPTLTVAALDSQGVLCPVCADIFILFCSCCMSISRIQPFQSCKRGTTISKLFVEIPPSTPLTNITLTSSGPWSTNTAPFFFQPPPTPTSHHFCYEQRSLSSLTDGVTKTQWQAPLFQQNCWTLGPSQTAKDSNRNLTI